MKAVHIARKTLLELWREPLLIGILFIFPVLLVWMYDVAFGNTEQGLASLLKILVLDQDRVPSNTRIKLGESLIQTLEDLQYDGKPVFEVSRVSDLNNAEIALREHKATLLMVIPEDFTTVVTAAAQGANTPPAEIKLIGETTSDTFTFARSFLDGTAAEFARQITRQGSALQIQYEFIPGTGSMSDFDFGVPGVIAFGIMLMVASVAMVMVRENVAHTLQRLRLTCLKARDLLLGVTLAHLLLALIIAPVTLGAALLFGFQNNGSLLLACLVCLLLSLSAIGFGLIVACFARTDSEAANLGAAVGVLQVLLSDAMYPVPSAPIATIGGRAIEIYDLLPPTHAAEALRRVLILGEGIQSITFELAALALFALITLFAGIVLYHRLQLQRK
jgi:ABC-2 type transport system permease protein